MNMTNSNMFYASLNISQQQLQFSEQLMAKEETFVSFAGVNIAVFILNIILIIIRVYLRKKVSQTLKLKPSLNKDIARFIENPRMQTRIIAETVV